MSDIKKKTRIGLALSGASSRSIFYIGFLEALEAGGVEIDYIAACSGASIVAASFAAGTLDLLKQRMLTFKQKFFLEMLDSSQTRSGLYNLDTFEQFIKFYTKGLRFEDLKIPMAFVAADIESGQQVSLHMGDIARAARISCTLPGIFEPVKWGNKLLVDGGLISIVPGDVVRQAGVDVVVGIDMRGNRHIFRGYQIKAKKMLNAVRQTFLLNHAGRLWSRVREFAFETVVDYYAEYGDDASSVHHPSIVNVLSRSLDLAIEAQSDPKRQKPPFDCDLLIVPDAPKLNILKSFLNMVDFSNAQRLYELGKATGEAYVPKIKQLLN